MSFELTNVEKLSCYELFTFSLTSSEMHRQVEYAQYHKDEIFTLSKHSLTFFQKNLKFNLMDCGKL